jgi:CheY-like chemotaxis protein
MATILYVDDELDNLWATREIALLREKGHDILLARDGQDALNVMKDHYVNLVITDNNMPVMTGVELYHAMRGNRDFAPIPVIFHSYTNVPCKGMTEAYNSPKSSDPGELMWVIDHMNP